MLLRNACLKFYKSADIEITQEKCTIIRKRKVYRSELFVNGDSISYQVIFHLNKSSRIIHDVVNITQAIKPEVHSIC